MKRGIVYIFAFLLILLWNQGVQAQQKPLNNQLKDNNIIPVKTGIPLVTPSPAELPVVLKEGVEKDTTAVNNNKVSDKQQQSDQESQHPKKAKNLQDTVKVLEGDASSSLIPIGYGRFRSRDELTSAITNVGAGDLPERSSVMNSERLLLYSKAPVPGLFLLPSPGGSKPPTSNFLIRGKETMNNNQPLVLVDGFPGTFRRIQPAAIKSISVLKDAAALAIYGGRGANGVILIKTKRGRKHPLHVTASYNQSVSQPLGLPHFLGAPQYAKALNEARANDGLSPRYTKKDIKRFASGKYPYLYPNVDWFKQALRNYGLNSNTYATFDGGGDVARYFVALNYSHRTGIIRPAYTEDPGYKTSLNWGRFDFRSNLDINLTDNLLLKTDFHAWLYDIHNPIHQYSVGTVFNALYSLPSAAYPVKLPNGIWGGTQVHPNNPRAVITDTGPKHPTARQLSLKAVLRQDLDNILEGLSVEGFIHYYNFSSYHQGKSRNYLYGNISAVRDQKGNILGLKTNTYSQNTSLQYHDSFGNQKRANNVGFKLNYSNTFGNDKLDAMILAEQNVVSKDGVNNVDHRRKLAGEVHYGLNGTYFFTVAASYAGRNLLPEANRYTFFPAVSAAWLLSNEDFLNKVPFLNRLKLKASWGESGWDNIPRGKPFVYGYDYGVDYHAAYFRDNYKHFASFGLPNLPATNFRIATSHKINIGLNVGLFNHLNLLVNVFRERRTDIHVGAGSVIANTIGITIPQESDGIVKNRGLEAALTWKETTGNVTWHIGGQFTYASNEIVNKDEQYRPFDYLKRTGKPIGQRFGLQAIGFFKDRQDITSSPEQLFGPVQPGDIKYKDQNGDHIINQFDVVPLGYTAHYPQIYYTASFGFNFKGFGFSAQFQGIGHQTAYLNLESVYRPLQNNNTISRYYYKHRWTRENAANATFPRLTTEDNPNNFRGSSVWMRNWSYIELRYAELSYALPASLVHSLNMDMIKIMVQGRNLYTWDHFSVTVPEQRGSGYPVMRYYTLGLEVAF